MELEQNGNSIPIDLNSPTLLGRDLLLGFISPSSSHDRTISRQHLSLHLHHACNDQTLNPDDSAQKLLLSFEVIGKNPISVITNDSERSSRVYKKSEKGVLNPGDQISLSIKKPNYFVVKRREGGGDVDGSVLDAVRRRERRTRQRRREAEERKKPEAAAAGEDDGVVWDGCSAEIGSVDVTEVDPVKEFGFLERGHEFDRYPRDKIRHFKDWNWFLEDTRAVSSEDDDENGTIKLKGKNKHHKNKKRGKEDDEEWAVESEDEGNLAAKAASTKRPTLSTRSKDPKKPHPKKPRSDVPDSKRTAENKFDSGEDDDDNEEDETLGGFIVGDDDLEEDEEEEVLEEESEEQEDDEDDEESDVD